MCINNCIDNNFSETAMPVYTKFHVEISVEGGFSAYFSGLAQDDCHAHIWYKILKSLLENQESFKFIIILHQNMLWLLTWIVSEYPQDMFNKKLTQKIS